MHDLTLYLIGETEMSKGIELHHFSMQAMDINFGF